MPTDFEQIRAVENIAADAVPAAVVEMLGGWRLRFNHGVKRRPNSVLANFDDGTEIEAKITQAEAFYAAYGLKARFQLSPASQPQGLDEILAARGYNRVTDAVCVQVAPLSAARFPKARLLETHLVETHSPEALSPGTHLSEIRPQPTPKVVMLENPDETFLQLYCETEQLAGIQAATLQKMLSQLPGKTVFALAYSGGRPAATGVGVLHGGRLGLFNIATHPAARRRGLASAALTRLLRWGQQGGATEAYLQVSESNLGAQAVYEQLGFKTLYHYHYREAP